MYKLPPKLLLVKDQVEQTSAPLPSAFHHALVMLAWLTGQQAKVARTETKIMDNFFMIGMAPVV
jgi:hypothetical protein